ncbi:hypothetical protein [Arthrobacter woluwensis]|uniref:Uncharacterized protein n=1 Tax=Arthrobacter woluwensis TaxID=156980 RepID=A0A1H4WD11_9MICC|nr:hypothetical protein [Arthrobacter woluwensis]SEC54398.1 hypothetical protein SAMN04489745_3137 [Arthrobacter woluwensis]SEC90648.1 hypothetical protein SAMN04489745_3478 [Arthrobacter woluwensis]
MAISPEHIRTAWRDCGGKPEDFDHWLTHQRSEWFGKGLDACAEHGHGIRKPPKYAIGWRFWSLMSLSALSCVLFIIDLTN